MSHYCDQKGEARGRDSASESRSRIATGEGKCGQTRRSPEPRVFKSGYFPKILGVLLMIACFGYLIDVFVIFLFPSYEAIAYPGLAVAATAEISFGLWLLFKGLKKPRQDATAVPT